MRKYCNGASGTGEQAAHAAASGLVIVLGSLGFDVGEQLLDSWMAVKSILDYIQCTSSSTGYLECDTHFWKIGWVSGQTSVIYDSTVLTHVLSLDAGLYICVCETVTEAGRWGSGVLVVTAERDRGGHVERVEGHVRVEAQVGDGWTEWERSRGLVEMRRVWLMVMVLIDAISS
ncbi:hypothetical protein Tco_0987471 [Tanacetum coccineum]